MPKGTHRKPAAARKPRGEGLGMGTRAKPTHTPLIALRLPPELLVRADALVPALVGGGGAVARGRSTVLRLALAEGLRVLERRVNR